MKINKMMKYAIWIKMALFVVLAAVCAVAALWLFKGVSESSIEIRSDPQIAVTPQKIAEIKRIGQWEFVSVSDEVVVDTVVKRVLVPDDRLTCIYYGTLSIGVDLDKAADDWAVNHGDTITVKLPKPGLLDQNFIDEASTRVFYESGTWRPAARKAMLRRAGVKMKAFALTPANLKRAEEAASDRFERLFKAMGAKEVIVSFEPF